MKKFFFGAAVTIILLALLSWYWGKGAVNDRPEADASDRSVVTTFFPAYDIAKYLAGDRLSVVKVIPSGAEIHHFEPSPDAVAAVSRSGLFVYGGSMLEPWAAKLAKELSLGDRILDISRDIEVRTPSGDLLRREVRTEASVYDPHYWLDIDNLAVMTEAIRVRLTELAPSDAAYFNERAATYIAELRRLDQAYRDGLSACRQRRLVLAGHRTFAYLSARYGLELISVEGLDPEAETRPDDLVAAIKAIKESGPAAVYSEEMLDSRVAETIAAETGAKILHLHGLHNLSLDDERLGLDLFTLLRNNLSQLMNGLECRN